MATNGRTLDECVRDRAKTTPELQLLAYPDVLSGKYVDYSAKVLDQIVQTTALHYQKVLPQRKTSNESTHTIALLGVSSLEYIFTFLALQRLGLTCLFLSTRLAKNALKHLLDTCDCQYIIVQPAFLQNLPGSLFTVPFISGAKLATEKINEHEKALDIDIDPGKEIGKISHIIHSSGSTGLPKPVPVKHGNAIVRSGVQFASTDFGFTCLPLFHNYGLFTLTFAIQSGIKGIFPSAERPLTGSTLLRGLKDTNARMLYCVPYTLKMLSEAEGGVEVLKGLKQVTLSGASCPEDLGDMVVRAGVNLMNYYGSTETGNIMRRSADNWNWLQLFPVMEKTIIFELRGDESQGLYECVALPDHRLNGKPNREDGCYATKDLFIRHPSDPSKWKYIGRLDDTIVLSNGEKVNPVVIEDSVRLSPYVSEAVVFGAERPSLGLLVIASERSLEEGLSEKDVADLILNEVDIGNKASPAYARISPDAIKVKKYGTTWPKTDKGNVIRAAFIQKFDTEIAAFYEGLERANEQSSEPRLSAYADIESLVRTTVAEEVKISNPFLITPSADFFSLGCDSLGAINIRRRLAKRVETNGKRLGNNLVFEHPTLESITNYLTRLSGGEELETKKPEEELLALLEKYSSFEHQDTQASERILLTGATGSLGSHILYQLLQSPTVDRVYCLIRAETPGSAMERVIASLKHSCLLDELSSPQLGKIESWPCDLSLTSLGLNPTAEEEVKKEVTTVIHSAWFVNFNMDISSFEEMHIKGTRNLLSMCLRSQRQGLPSFNFVSSISSAFGFKSSKPIPESLPPLQPGVGVPIMGYARSKLIAEHLCGACTRQTGLTTRILRVGQIIGDSRSGAWSTSEAWPTTIQTAFSIRALPVAGQRGEDGDEDEVCRWLPVDTVAKTVVELSLGESKDENKTNHNGLANGSLMRKEIEVYNIQHPIPLLWKRDIIPILRRAGLVFECVPVAEWMRRVESNDDPVSNPAIRLIDFFAAKYGNRRDGKPVTGDEFRLDWAESEQHNVLKKSAVLRNALPVDEKLLLKNVEYWMGIWGASGKAASE